MRFITPAQTLAEHTHRKMPVFETLGLSATTALGIGAAGAAVGGLGSLGLGIYNASKKAPGAPNFNQYANPKQNLLNAQDIYNQAANEGIDFAQRGTAANVSNQDVVTPGSSAQREQALNILNAYMQGQVPQDVQQQINRQVAQNLGGGFNLFNGGGQAPQNFARNLGQTSLGLSQFGLSAAPTWQQLANQMVVSPTVGLQAGLQAAQIATGQAGLAMQGQENQYQAAMNQYGSQQAGTQGIQQGLGALGSAGSSIMNAGILGNYYGGLSNSALGARNTLSQAGFAGGQLPSYLESPYASGLGYVPQSVTALPSIQF
jgi:hypothetical protein